ncbi:MAG: chemotaxis protein CheW [Gammaproteobacteria bacterium]|nr:chemotaxis protein CheW [Gammaproteobacteria bacterium]MDH3447657.1 chemotaxis protein CheW [Gammaproteobacteria bacterium]
MNDKATSVRCMLLQLTSLNLLIPNSAVAEIIGYSTPRRLPDTSDWFAGVVLWRGVYVPVVAVEQMCNVDTAQVGPRGRIAIIYNPEKDPDLPYLGIHMQDIPRAYLAETDSMESGSDEGLSEYLITRVDDEQLARVIPDLDKIIAALKLEFNQNRIEELNR